MHYLIDGYNLLFHLSESDNPFQKQREKLLDYLNEQASTLHLHFTVIFDGSVENDYTSYATHGCLEILFSSNGESADDLILREASRAKNPQKITIVTSDKKLLHKARHYKTHSLSIPQFLRVLSKKT